jgi:hypothetical protein
MTSGGGKVVIPTNQPHLAKGGIPGTRCVRGLVDLRVKVRPENPNDLTRNRTRYLPVFSAMSQPIAPPRSQTYLICFKTWNNLSDGNRLEIKAAA